MAPLSRNPTFAECSVVSAVGQLRRSRTAYLCSLMGAVTCCVIPLATLADEPVTKAVTKAVTKDRPAAESGLEVGDKVHQFYVRAVTGPHKGRSVCYVCRNGDRPVVMLLVREVTPELPKLLRAVDEIVDQNRAVGLRSFGVFLAQDSKEVLPQVQTLAFNENIALPLTVAAAPMEGPSGKRLSPNTAVAVILYRDHRVVANYACRADELTDERIRSIEAGIREMTREP